ncbi:MAG: hypothetical protein AAFV98_19040 [Chloroflexota bacterium]
MSASYDISKDLKEAKAMTDGLADYLRGDVLYGSTQGGFFSRMPSLTVGALLMRLRRLDALRNSMMDSDRRTLDAIIEQWQAVRDEWRVHYEDKLQQEASSRINAMKSFFQECRDSMQSCRNNYRPELQKRTIVQEILLEMRDLNIENADLMKLVNAADTKFHSYMRPDSFQWSDDLKDVYPEDDFWWLYQKPPQLA